MLDSCSAVSVQRSAVLAAGPAAMFYYYSDSSMPVYPEPRPGVSVPVYVLNGPVGAEIAGLFVDETNPPVVTVSLTCPVSYYDVYTRNLIVDTYAGNGDNVIVVGSHSDSVPAGPGINDDGSGTASNLEILLQYYKLYSRSDARIVNRVRFVFFGAEELGLLGSFAYVASLNATNAATHALDRVVGALDHDMFGEC